jgi:hypothetical protein
MGKDSSRGSAYVFKHSDTTWTEEAKLVASDGKSGDHFGWSASISDGYILIEAYDDDSGCGSAYVFMQEGGENQTSDTSTKTPGFELIAILIAVALILFFNRKKI